MINTSQLTHANLLFDKNKTICTVFNINKSTVRCYVDNDLEEALFNAEDLFPIPLTPETLRMIGVVQKASNSNIWYVGKFVFALTPNGMLLMDANQNLVPGAIPIKHMHMLQNLMFFMAGREMQLVK